MDPSSSQTSTLPSQSTDSQEISHVNRELYKKNLELAERNKTLSVLRKIDTIILSTVTDIQQIAQQVANLVVDETEYIKAIVVLLHNKQEHVLYRLAISQTEAIRKAELQINKSFQGLKTSLTDTNSLVIKSVQEKKMQLTHDLFDVLAPHFTKDEAKTIQEILGNTSSLVYPLIVRDDVIGSMIISIEERDKSLSYYQLDLIDRLPGIIAIAIDNALLYKELQDANRRLQELDHMKDEFVSLASHELRTPLTAIKSYLWLLIEQHAQNLDEKQKLYVQRSYASTERLIKLVNDMLNISRIESGRLSITMRPINLSALTTEMINELIPTAQKQGVTIKYLPPQPSLSFVIADADKTKTVLTNLLGNALKFTPAGGTITISQFLQNGFLQTSIQDTGRGILRDDLPKLFHKFQMVGSDVLKRQDSQQGSGLGLYITRSVVELQGGKIWVESLGENKGSTFSFTLKAAPPQIQDDANNVINTF